MYVKLSLTLCVPNNSKEDKIIPMVLELKTERKRENTLVRVVDEGRCRRKPQTLRTFCAVHDAMSTRIARMIPQTLPQVLSLV